MDPITLRLAEEETQRRTMSQIGNNSRVVAAERAAAFLPVSESLAAQTLTDMVDKVLQDRVKELAMADDQCLAMLKIMDALTSSRGFAQRAVALLMNK
jgi:hypothetical protein